MPSECIFKKVSDLLRFPTQCFWFELSGDQRKILKSVYDAGGGDLVISSLDRPNDPPHTNGRAIDFGVFDRDLYPVILKVFLNLERLGGRSQYGIGIGYPPADPHLHVDVVGVGNVYVETSKTRPVQLAIFDSDRDGWTRKLKAFYGDPESVPDSGLPSLEREFDRAGKWISNAGKWLAAGAVVFFFRDEIRDILKKGILD